MRISRHISTSILAVITVIAAWNGLAGAATYNINWLDMSPTPINSSVPNASVFVVPGIGNVTLTYSIGANVSDARGQNPNFVVGSVVSGPDTYQWTNHEYFSTILNSGPDPLVPVLSTLTYTFPATLSPGTVFVGTIGLGATTSFGGGASTTTVNQNGTFLGDFAGPGGFGPSLFTPGAGTFTVQNSLTAPGGVDPHWNTQLGVVRIDDPVSSITIYQSGIRGDGIGVNIGFVPDHATPTAPSSWGRIKQLYR